ncbi:MAG: YncE family protein [Proteobacteria bacterium]|nr:YncE family protein [Pseudomonadota bacterium]
MRMRTLLAALFTLSTAAAAAGSDAGYAIAARWRTGGAGGWDYVTLDAPKARLFVTRGDHVDVVDLGSGHVTATVGGANGAHGVALAPELGRGWISNGRGNSVTEFDYQSLAVLRTVAVPGENPDAILYEPHTRRLFTFNGRSRDVTVFDAATLAVVGRVPVPGKPEFARSDERGRVYANIETAPGQLVRIDAATLALEASWTLAGCDEPTGLALDAAGSRLFSVCDHGVMAVTDGESGRAVARLPIGDGPDGAEYDPARHLVFSSNGADGTLTVIRQLPGDRYVAGGTLPTARGARTMTLDPATHRLYLVTAEFGPAPAATTAEPRPRPVPLPDSFTVLVAAPR